MAGLDPQLTTTVLLGVIGLIVAGGLVGTVFAFWTLGRQAYRKE